MLLETFLAWRYGSARAGAAADPMRVRPARWLTPLWFIPVAVCVVVFGVVAHAVVTGEFLGFLPSSVRGPIERSMGVPAGGPRGGHALATRIGRVSDRRHGLRPVAGGRASGHRRIVRLAGVSPRADRVEHHRPALPLAQSAGPARQPPHRASRPDPGRAAPAGPARRSSARAGRTSSSSSTIRGAWASSTPSATPRSNRKRKS